MAEIGDTVCHIDEAHPNRIAVVIGFCPGHEWRRVKTRDGRHRIWAVKNMTVLHPETVAIINESPLRWITSKHGGRTVYADVPSPSKHKIAVFQTEDDARLGAAAPEMLAALCRALPYVDDQANIESGLDYLKNADRCAGAAADAIRAVIAKATSSVSDHQS